MIRLLFASIAVCLIAGPSQASIVVLGDSLSDNGNLFQGTGGTGGPFFSPLPGSYFPTPPYDNGRASNGPLWVEVLADKLGQPTPQPGFLNPLTGSNFAVIGATTGPGSPTLFGAPNLYDQRDAYLSVNTPAVDDLFVVWAGANDFLAGQTNPAVPVAQITQVVLDLIAAEAREFLIPNIPLLGETPFYNSTPARPLLNGLSATFNNLLAAQLDLIRTTNPLVTIHELDAAGLFTAATLDPAAFGLTNVTDSAVAFDSTTGVPLFPTQVVPNADEYLYWDFVHPTQVAHEFLGEAAFNTVVPEPTSFLAWSLLATMSSIVVFNRRRRSR